MSNTSGTKAKTNQPFTPNLEGADAAKEAAKTAAGAAEARAGAAGQETAAAQAELARMQVWGFWGREVWGLGVWVSG